MKRKAVAAALALCVLLSGAAVAAGGGQSDPLISLSYLNGTYWTQLEALADAAAARAMQPIYDAALGKAGFAAGAGGTGGVLKLSLGSGLVWAGGSGKVRAGLLVDATAGAEVRPGGAMVPGHRYLAAEDSSVMSLSGDAAWLAEGRWSALPATGLDFIDVAADSWYCANVQYAVAKGLFQGVTATEFRPSGQMTRGMAAMVLYRVAGAPPVSYAPLFTDVPEDRWYAPAAVWAGQNQIDAGAEGRFRPNEDVTRQELAAMLYRYARSVGADASGTDLGAFTDGGSVADWAREALGWAVRQGIMEGSGGQLRPGASASRAEVAAMFQRFQTWLEAG